MKNHLGRALPMAFYWIGLACFLLVIVTALGSFNPAAASAGDPSVRQESRAAARTTRTATIKSPLAPGAPTACGGTLNGLVFIDLNGNGVPDPGEPGLGGVTIDLKQGGTVVRTTTSNANGSYLISNITLGSYTVVETVPPGYTPTSPSSVGANFPDCSPVVVTFGLLGATPTATATPTGPGRSTPTPTNTPTGTPATATATSTSCGVGSVRGTVFNDLNGNGVLDPGEPPISGVTVELDKFNGHGYSFYASQVTTAGSPNYDFSNLPPAPYQVVVKTPSGYQPTSPTTVGVDLDSCANLLVDFGNSQGTATPTSTSTPTDTPTNTPTNTPTGTPTDTPTNTPTSTLTNTPTNTPTGTITVTDTPTNTPTDTPTDTPTNTPTGTITVTDTPTNTPTDTPTDTPTNTPTGTLTDTPTATRTGTTTKTATPTVTPTGSVTPPSHLTISKVASPKEPPVSPGDQVIFNITVKNTSNKNELGVVVTDNVPAGLDIISVTPNKGGVSIDNNVITIVIGTMVPNETDTVLIVTKVNDSVSGNNITNCSDAHANGEGGIGACDGVRVDHTISSPPTTPSTPSTSETPITPSSPSGPGTPQPPLFVPVTGAGPDETGNSARLALVVIGLVSLGAGLVLQWRLNRTNPSE